MLLCDFHIHTNYSDGSMELKEVVDVFGQAGFDVISITDHVVNGDSTIGKLAHSFNYTITKDNFPEYMDAIRYEKERAWSKYGMLIIPGVEISKNYISSDLSAHILLIDLKDFISASCDYDEIFSEAKKQDALVVACHPHQTSGMTSKDTYYLWNNRERFAKHIDAWEIANRDDVFNVVSLKKYPYIANSDFHKARHLYSWKTLLNCAKDTESIKQCIRHNKGVAITLFRN
jgi:predicted metal-dependent phosphoesterase TrpH